MPDDLIPGKYRHDLIAHETGELAFIDSHEVVEITRHLGCPLIKEAGIYFHYEVGEQVKKGDVYATLYATSQARLDMTVDMFEKDSDPLISIV